MREKTMAGLAGKVGDMSATCRRQGKMSPIFVPTGQFRRHGFWWVGSLLCRYYIFSDIDGPKTDIIVRTYVHTLPNSHVNPPFTRPHPSAFCIFTSHNGTTTHKQQTTAFARKKEVRTFTPRSAPQESRRLRERERRERPPAEREREERVAAR